MASVHACAKNRCLISLVFLALCCFFRLTNGLVQRVEFENFGVWKKVGTTVVNKAEWHLLQLLPALTLAVRCCPVVPYAVWIKRKRFSPRPKCKSSPRVYVHIRSPGVFPGASASLNSNCQLSNHWMLQRFWLQSLLPSTSTWARGTAYKQKSALSSSHIICILCRLPLTEVRITKSCNVFISTATEGRWICFYST